MSRLAKRVALLSSSSCSSAAAAAPRRPPSSSSSSAAAAAAAAWRWLAPARHHGIEPSTHRDAGIGRRCYSSPSSSSGYHVSPSSSMKGAVFRDPARPLSLELLQIPRPQPGEVLIRTKACGVCCSDLPVLKGDHTFASPCVVGHEITGEVVEHHPLTDSKMVHRFPVGSLVVGMPCGSYFHCSEGHDDLCEDFFAYSRGRGTPRDGNTREPVYMNSMGGMAEYCVVLATGLAVLPASLPYSESAILGCTVSSELSCELSCLQIAKAFGASDIIAVDISDEKLQKAKIFGVAHTVNALKEDAIEKIKTITGGMGVDIAVEALGKRQTFMQCAQSVMDGGKAVMIGLARSGAVGEVDTNRLDRRKVNSRVYL
ncbi:hypothetical protein NL676_014325 [Syzygium grande]|nr:hypothetical protein NL676_014325 [Syzygium grande]